MATFCTECGRSESGKDQPVFASQLIQKAQRYPRTHVLYFSVLQLNCLYPGALKKKERQNSERNRISQFPSYPEICLSRDRNLNSTRILSTIQTKIPTHILIRNKDWRKHQHYYLTYSDFFLSVHNGTENKRAAERQEENSTFHCRTQTAVLCSLE